MKKQSVDLIEFGQKLQRFRQAAGLTQEKLAEKVEVSAANMVSKWERGLIRPGRQRLIVLIRLLADSGVLPYFEAEKWALLAGHQLTGKELALVFSNYPAPVPPATFKKPWQHPPLPDQYIERKALEAKLHDFLMRAGPQKTLVLTGRGGVGKTTLASWAANEFKEQFSDGVIWLDFRQTQDVYTLQKQIADSLNAILIRTSMYERTGELRSLLNGKHCLLVLDDVWGDNPELAYLKVNNDTCPMLLTTRDKIVARIFEAGPPIEVTGLTATEGYAMLAPSAGLHQKAILNKLVARLEGLPLALKLVESLLGMGDTSEYLLQKLGNMPSDLTTLDITNNPTPVTSLKACFDLSYHRLPSAKMRQYFAQTSVFPGPFSAEAAATLWRINPSQAHRVLIQLVRFNLVNRDEHGYWLHVLLRDFALYQLTTDWKILVEHSFRRHAAYTIRHQLEHPHLLGETDQPIANLDENWNEIVAGVSWAAHHAPKLATMAVVLAYTERQPLLAAVGPILVEAVEKYLDGVTDKRERALLLELSGELRLLQDDKFPIASYFETVATLWQAEMEFLSASRAKVRAAGGSLLKKDWPGAVAMLQTAQNLLKHCLPISDSELLMGRQLFYWLDVVYNVVVKWTDVPEADLISLAELGQKTCQPVLEAQAWHIYRLWCSAEFERRQDETIRQKSRHCAAKAACIWRRCGEIDKAQSEVMWTQEYTQRRRNRRLAEAFAYRRSKMTPTLSQVQIDSFKSEAIRMWLSASEPERVKWLADNMPPPGSDDWERLDYILNLGIRGKSVRRLVTGAPRPEDHFLSEPMWRVLTGQRVLPLCGAVAIDWVNRCRSELQTELS